MPFGHFALILAIAAAQRARDGQGALPDRFDHVAISAFEPLAAERQPPQLVPLVRIDARLVEHDIGREIVEHARQMLAVRLAVPSP